MRLIAPILLLILLIISIPILAKKSKLSPEWIPVTGIVYKNLSTRLFYDHSSMSRSKSNIGRIGLLMTSDKPMRVIIDDTPLITRSIVKYFVMDCDSGLMAPASNYYYSVAMPTTKDKPFAVYTYSNMSGTETVKKSSLMYGLVCATPI